MLALSPARDLFALSSSTTKAPYHNSSNLLNSSLSLNSALNSSFSFTKSFTSSSRQQPFVETPAQRRARVAFLQKENHEGERRAERVESWVRDQAQHSAFMVKPAKMLSESEKVYKGHKRGSGTYRREGAFAPKLVPDEIILGRMFKDSSNVLSSITEEEEPYILYSTPIPRYSMPAPYYNITHLSPTNSSRKPSHQRRLSDLEAIPEE
ncbi:hypothetical protein DFJ43DRAFT_1156965 [Lentinula guzmanii]|uniref:Uncharacterized protein n=1 Tax=Lentinula guzmanii TaxID=2804957 RepID=A0AA38JG99_9AGAR|nr:hypothetical protein DFJ43DRAFT_1156965 [Lentinula guzmanii]